MSASCLSFKPERSKAVLSGVKRILCMKFWGLGNLAIIYPLLYKIKEKFPNAHLTFITFDKNRGFLENNYAVDKIVYLRFTTNIFLIVKQFIRFVIRFRKEKVDLLINFETFNNTSALFSYLTKASIRIGLINKYESIFYTHSAVNDKSKHISETFSGLLKSLGINYPYRYSSFTTREENKIKIAGILNHYGAQKFVCIHPGTSSNFKGKRYRKDYFAELANLILGKYDVTIFLTGTQSEGIVTQAIIKAVQRNNNIFDLAGSLTIWEFEEFLRESFLFISSDTGPVHLVASLGINLAVFYGPTTPLRYGPLNDNSLVFYKNIKCSPCVGVDYINKKCKGNFQCLDFSPEEAFKKISERFFDEKKNQFN